MMEGDGSVTVSSLLSQETSFLQTTTRSVQLWDAVRRSSNINDLFANLCRLLLRGFEREELLAEVSTDAANPGWFARLILWFRVDNNEMRSCEVAASEPFAKVKLAKRVAVYTATQLLFPSALQYYKGLGNRLDCMHPLADVKLGAPSGVDEAVAAPLAPSTHVNAPVGSSIQRMLRKLERYLQSRSPLESNNILRWNVSTMDEYGVEHDCNEPINAFPKTDVGAASSLFETPKRIIHYTVAIASQTTRKVYGVARSASLVAAVFQAVLNACQEVGIDFREVGEEAALFTGCDLWKQSNNERELVAFMHRYFFGNHASCLSYEYATDPSSSNWYVRVLVAAPFVAGAMPTSEDMMMVPLIIASGPSKKDSLHTAMMNSGVMSYLYFLQHTAQELGNPKMRMLSDRVVASATEESHKAAHCEAMEQLSVWAKEAFRKEFACAPQPSTPAGTGADDLYVRQLKDQLRELINRTHPFLTFECFQGPTKGSATGAMVFSATVRITHVAAASVPACKALNITRTQDTYTGAYVRALLRAILFVMSLEPFTES